MVAYYSRKLNKKADINLSINAVVILILALVMLGVGIAFIRGTFGGLIEQVQNVGDEIGEQKLQELRECKEPICFTQTRVTLRQSKARIPYSVHNNENKLNDFAITWECDDTIGADDSQKSALLAAKPTSLATVKLESGETRLLDFNLELPSDTPTGVILYCKVGLKKSGGEDYANKRFEIEFKKK